ncbi:MAG: ABC transporter permease [Spirochaetaceae bacterium]|nr:ABC transporter permease [Spirochaetaceae bacterium]
MYRRYLAKRVAYGILMYVAMIFVYSTLFNSVADRTMRSLIDEQLAQEATRYRNLSEDQLRNLVESRREQKYDQYHLNDPLLERIFFRAIRTIAFDYGNSTTMKAPNGDRLVIRIILEALPKTIVLFTTQIAIVTVLGVAMGLYAAQKPGGLLDRTTSLLTMITNGLPAWWLGMLAIMFFAYTVPIFPSGGLRSNPPPVGFLGMLDFLWHLALPLLTLVVLGIWGTAYLVRNIVLSNLQEDYVMAARARGIPERAVLFGHTLRTSMPAIMTLAVLGLFSSIGGSIIVEGIFGWPGLGNLYFVAVQTNDVPVLMGSLSVQTLVSMLGFVILDLIYGLLDPRVKVGGKA